MLRKDVKSQLFSTGMLISLLLGLVLLVEPQYQYFLYFARWDNKADYINFFFSSLALGGYLIFTPIITVMLGVFRFCDEYNSGYLRFMLVRSKSRRKYMFSRLFSNAVCGGAANALPLAVFALIMLIFCAPYTPNGHSKTPLDGSILQPFENVAGGLGLVGVIILLAFLFGVVWGAIGTALSAAVPNRYVALCGPFVLFFLMHLVASALQKEKFSPTNTILPDILPSFGFLFLYQAVLLVLGCAAFIFFARRRLLQ